MVELVAFLAMCIVVGYLFGTISTAYIIGKKNNIDIREHGSKNAGTTNAMRTMGRTAGILVFLGDCIKAAVAILIMLGAGMIFKIDVDPETVKLATGFGAVLGHNFPFWMGFKGGKGIAVTASAMIAFCFDKENFWFILLLIALFAIIVKTTKYVSLGSLAIVTAFLIFVALGFQNHAAYVRLLILALLFTLLAYFMHRQNIVRLFNGTENKVGQKKKEQNNQQVNNQINNVPMNNQQMGNQMNNQMNNQQMNNQQMNNQINNVPMNNQMINNQMGNQQMNNMFLEPSDLVDTNISDFKNIKNTDKQTEQLYNTGYFQNIRKQNSNTNEVNINNGNNAYYKAYDECDTVDETRQMDETEYLDEVASYDSQKSYYEK